VWGGKPAAAELVEWGLEQWGHGEARARQQRQQHVCGEVGQQMLRREVGLGLMGACACAVERSGAAAGEAGCAGFAAVA